MVAVAVKNKIENQKLSMFSFLTVFFILTSAKLVSCLSRKTGLVQLRRSSENPYDCSRSLPVFVCTTSGLGETRISLSSVAGAPIRLRHARYTNVSTTMTLVENNYHELIAAANLSKSSDKDCFDRVNNRIDFCYITMFIVHLTDQIICNTINCNTIFNNGSHDIPEQFGNATITTMPPAPTNLHMVHQSLENITFTWDHVTKNCSDVHYNVTILSCGRCPQNMNTTNNIITCKHPVPGQRCSISIQTVQPCGFSNTTTLEVLIGGETTSAQLIQDKPDIIGAIAGGVFALLLMITIPLIIITTCIVCIKKHKTRLQSRYSQSDDSQQHKQDDARHQEIKEMVYTGSASAIELKEKTAVQDDSPQAQIKCEHEQDVVNIQEMKENIKRVGTKLENAKERKNEAEKRESIAQEQLQQAQKEVFRLEHEQKKIEKQIELHREDADLNDVLVTSLERTHSDLANAGRRKDEAERNETVAYEEMQRAHDEEHRLSLKQNEIMERVNVYSEAINKRVSKS